MALVQAPPTDAHAPTGTTDRPASPTKPSSSSSVKASTSSAPVRPPARQTRSKLDLEPNPFEQSFSGKSASAEPQDVKVEPSSDVRVTVDGAPAVEGLVDQDSKPLLLPSVSQLVSPEHEDGPFNWNMNTPAISSLRSGPLSPAMLAGPKQGQQAVVSHAMQFDASNFVRTGLTPGTGLTPLSGGPSSFPPPSPGTANFLAMVTNATAAASQMGPDGAPLPLTPGTFNTVMSQLGNTLNGPSHVSGNVVGGHQPHPLANSHVVGGGQPDYFSHRPEEGQQSHVQQQQQQQQQHQQHQQQMMHQQQQYAHPQMGYPQQFPPQQNGGPLPPHLQQHQQHGGPPPPPEHYRQQNVAAASQAANGLFLLSQAHQEIAAREHDGPGGPPPNHMQQHQPPKAPHPGAAPLVPPPSTRAGNKRKTSGPTEAAAPPPKKTARAAAGGAAKRGKKQMSVESDDYEGMEAMSPDQGGSENGANGQGNGLNKDGKPETEEEKRKNFLERNRQAALKCRQRKKAWLGQLQAKVEYLQGENEGLQQTIASLRDEVTRLSGMVGGGAPGGPVYTNGTGQPQPQAPPPMVPGGPAPAGAARRGGPAY